MFAPDGPASVLAGFEAREENHAASFLCIAFKHGLCWKRVYALSVVAGNRQSAAFRKSARAPCLRRTQVCHCGRAFAQANSHLHFIVRSVIIRSVL